MKKIILDTDIGCDCDDCGAFAVLHKLADENLVEILAMTHTTSAVEGAGCIDSINRYYGRGEIPIGVLKEDGFCGGPENDVYSTALSYRFPGPYTKTPAPDAVRVLRETLAKAEDQSVTFVTIGQLRNTAHLLASQPDDISPLTGVELMKQKVCEVATMAGYFCNLGEKVQPAEHCDPEWNIRCDVESTQYFVEHCPVPITFAGFELGARVISGVTMVKEQNWNNPVCYAYLLHSNAGYSTLGRCSWDPITVLYAVVGLQEYWDRSPMGKVEILEDGTSFLKEDPNGIHSFLVEKMPPEEMEALLDEFMAAPPKFASSLPLGEDIKKIIPEA